MTAAISSIGNSHGILFDDGLMDLAHARPGDRYAVTVHDDGAIVLTPMERLTMEPEEAAAIARRLIGENDELFRRLA